MSNLELSRDVHYQDRLPVMADRFAKSSLCPDQFRGKPDDVYVIASSLATLDVELSFPVLAQCYVVHGKPGLMAELQQALAAKHGITIRPIGHLCTIESATVEVRLPSGETHQVTFTMEEAERAGLTKPAKSGEPSMYEKWPANMLRARATTRAISWYCPQVKLGMGRAGVIDVEEVELIDGPRGLDIVDAGDVDDTLEADPPARPDAGRWPARSIAPDGATIPAYLREPAVDDDVRATILERVDRLRGTPSFEDLARACKELGVPNVKTPRFTKAHGALLMRLIDEVQPVTIAADVVDASSTAGPGIENDEGSPSAPGASDLTEPAPGPADEPTPAEVLDDQPESYAADDPSRPFD